MNKKPEMGTNIQPGCEEFVPVQSQYLKISPTSQRYQLLLALAQEMGISWSKIAYYAIDEFLRQNPPLPKA